MASHTDAQHRSFLWVDIVGSSNPEISDRDRQAAKRGMYRSLRRAFRRARLPYFAWKNLFHRHQEDRGDGAFWLFRPSIPKSRLLKALPFLVTAVEAYNRNASRDASIRLRVALNAGEVNFDPHGVSGDSLNLTARLLDSGEFKDVVRGSGASVGVIASDWFYDNVIRHGPPAVAKEFEPLKVQVRDVGEVTAWVGFPAGARETGGVLERLRRWVGMIPFPPLLRRLLALVVLAAALLCVPGEVRPVACDEHPVQLRVRVSAEKEALVRALALEFERETRDQDGCRRAAVNVVAASSPGGAREALRQGWLMRDPKETLDEADVWLPDSSLDVEQAREALRVNRIGTVGLRVLGPVTTSRLVVAVPAAMADGLSLSGHTMTWDAMLGWPRQDYFFGRASPRASSTGLAATVALYQAALNARVLNREVLTRGDAASRLHTVEKSIAREDDEPGKLLCAMRESPPDGELRRTALLVSEKSLIDYRGDAPLGGGVCGGATAGQPELRPFYAEEGMPLLDHPYVVISRTPQPGPERRRIIEDFYRYLRQPGAQEYLKKAGYRDESGTTTERQDDIPSLLPPIDLTGQVHGEPLLDAWNTARKSAQVLFAVDVSRSMAAPFPYSKGTRVAAAADAIGLARPLIGAHDQIGLWEFADGVDGDRDHRSLVPVGAPDEKRIERLTDRLAGLRPSEHGTGLISALRAAIREMRERDGGDPDETTRAVIAITHGVDSGRAAAELAGEIGSGEPVRVYVIAFHPESCPAGLDQVTQAAGGACYEIDGMSAMRQALDGIATGLWGTPP
ncbi:substrate-binding domain-containing protein [Actinomadura sp. 9N407]|uniref:substrate-binding and vWA domain-containing protein n=1 Tax=Actinomadura sp. 9N407 TaxID=3375154 RepID=UPI00379AF12C